jgi:mannose-1-phosphate guanylyltransferase
VRWRGRFSALAAAPERVILLGIEAASPETEYGWIEPADTIGESEAVLPIRRFWEKPAPELAASLLSRGCLWNSFVMVGRVPAFIDLIGAGAQELVNAFEPVRRALGSSRERAAVERVYANLGQVNFSERVLEPAAARLGVASVKGVEWSDWGNAERVCATIRRTGWRPGWLERVSLLDGGLTPFPTALSA